MSIHKSVRSKQVMCTIPYHFGNVKVCPCKKILIPESGKFLPVEFGVLRNFASAIQNPGFLNLEYSSRNPESH